MNLRITYLDDEVDLTALFCELFARDGVQITTFNAPDIFIDQFRPDDCDVLFLDFRMPKVSGDELALGLSFNKPIYLITGEMEVTPRYPFTAILKKPFDIESINKIIDSLSH